jgi:manganese/iron transport system substrate-binding protein
MRSERVSLAALLLLALAALVGCERATPAARQGDRLQVVATTTIVGDVVRQIGGDAIDLQVLLPVGADPHAFEPTPKDVARIAGARVIFANGAGLEGFLDRLLASAGGQAELVHVSEGITLRRLEGEHHEGHDHGEADPHVWTDPNNVIVWTQNIEQALSRLDARNAGHYRANAEAYRAKLQELDAWVREQVAQIPEASRQLVTDHAVLGYLADRYGLQQVGVVFPGFSTLAEPSAQDLAALEDAIRKHEVRAVFVGTTINPALAQRLTADTGTRLVSLYTGSLSAPGGDAPTYLDYVRHNVSAIVQALK